MYKQRSLYRLNIHRLSETKLNVSHLMSKLFPLVLPVHIF